MVFIHEAKRINRERLACLCPEERKTARQLLFFSHQSYCILLVQVQNLQFAHLKGVMCRAVFFFFSILFIFFFSIVFPQAENKAECGKCFHFGLIAQECSGQLCILELCLSSILL